MPKEPVLVVFDIDGTLAKIETGAIDIYDPNYLFNLGTYPNMITIVRQYLRMKNAEILFCTGRPKRTFSATRRWLNKHLDLSSLDKRVGLVCRPDDSPESSIPTFKVSEILQAIRRLGSNPAEALIFDDDVQNLRLFETLKPMVRKLTLFKVTDGVVSDWSL